MAVHEATAEELRYALVAKIARPRLLALRDRFPESFLARGEQEGVDWRSYYREQVDEALDEALDAADVAIFAHSLALA